MAVHPEVALRRIAFLLERNVAPGYRVRAFRNAANTIAKLNEQELKQKAKNGSLRNLPGIGEKTEQIILEALEGKTPAYVEKLEAEEPPRPTGGEKLLAKLRGDCHTHSEWSDGLNPIEEMARTAQSLGRKYMVLTDHSPRLTIANGLTTERLRKQLAEVADLNNQFAKEAGTNADEQPFRILTGIEVDINEDGTLDQDPDVLAELDVVVGSVHSKLRSEEAVMTKRMLKAIDDPNLDILGHCTGRLVVGRGRPESTFDADAVFRACAANGVTVEINSRPERKDPPMRLLHLAADLGCDFSIDSDAHSPGQLDWLWIGCERAEKAEISEERIVNTKTGDDLLSWANTHRT